jgi:Divergent InlB B-repeat domain
MAVVTPAFADGPAVSLVPSSSGNFYPNAGIKTINEPGQYNEASDPQFGFTFYWKFTGSSHISISVTYHLGGATITNNSAHTGDLYFDFVITYTASGCTAATYYVTFYDDAGSDGIASATFTVHVYCYFYLTMQVSGNGYVSPGSGNQVAGSQVTITGTPNPGCHSFDHWTGTGTGSYSGTNNPATITMYSAITETATFNNLCRPSG